MLQSLHIENYALIVKLSMEFGSGLNLLTGETGSGKSIVVDALGLLLGGKGSADLIRSGADRAIVSGVFSVKRSLEDLGLEGDAGEIVVRRELNASGKTRVFINDRPATVGSLRSLAPWLAEIHGQNEQQELFTSAAQLEMLDRAAQVSAELALVADAHRGWRAAKERLESLNLQEQDKLRLADLWSFQKKEIETAAPKDGEDATLEAEKRLLANAGRIHGGLSTAYKQLYDAPTAASVGIATALKALEDIAKFDATLDPVCAELRSAKVSVEENSFTLRDRLEHLNANPKRLDQLEDRLAALDRLKCKYGPALADVLAHLEKVTRQLNDLESSEELAKEAAKEVEAAANLYRDAAATLSNRRRDAAKHLEKAVQKNLAELAMEGTRFRIRFAETPGESEWRANGTDRVEYLISPNPGEPLHLMKDTASGGELSRLMLALELAVGVGGRGGTLVFDEVDAGIGGRVAETVGRKLKALAASHQVLCVTHLPQIAAFAVRHYFVEKRGDSGRTVTSIRLLEEKDRPTELARMLGGTRITEAVLTHAADLLKAGRTT